MIYKNICHGEFLARPNRFIAQVRVNGKTETVHVKNTGRCRELLLPGTDVVLQESENPARKTRYDLIACVKPTLGWVNIDSQVPNAVVREWLDTQKFDLIRPEYTWGNSRFDFYMEKGEEKYLLEVKGCTLEIDGVGYFPDAVSERATKHVRELVQACKEGFHVYVAFVIAMEHVKHVVANEQQDPKFAEALESAQKQGVTVLNIPCLVSENMIKAIAVNVDWSEIK